MKWTSSPPYVSYGRLIHAWRNEIKHTLEIVARETGMALDRLKALEQGHVKPEWPELECLARQFKVSVRDLLPQESDLVRGIQILRHPDSKVIEQKRAGRLQYTYTSRVMSNVLPHFKPIELLLHLTNRDEVVMNRGHFFHQYTQVLHGGPVAFLWEYEGKVEEELFQTGDSWLIPGFVPHAFYSPDPKNLGRILAVTFGQHLTGDARLELQLMGPSNAPRIAEDALDYYPRGETA